MPVMNFKMVNARSPSLAPVNAKNLKMEFKKKLLKYGISIH